MANGFNNTSGNDYYNGPGFFIYESSVNWQNFSYDIQGTSLLISDPSIGVDKLVYSSIRGIQIGTSQYTLIVGTDTAGDNLTAAPASNPYMIIGGDGNDTLEGYDSADILIGGRGNDTYNNVDSGDFISEKTAEGTDTINTRISYTLNLSNLLNVENLTLIAGSGALNATGNALANVLIGNEGNNSLDGLGGADTMTGGGGNDTYYVNNIGDRVIESPGAGTDSIFTTISYTASAGVENISMLDATSTGIIKLTGNGLNNAMTGNAGANTLNGLVGADTMTGLGGNDTYIVDNPGDKTIESVGGGTDTVESFISWTLADQTENLVLKGSGAMNGSGNALDNTIKGNTSQNLLTGFGGNDTLDGGLNTDGTLDSLIGGGGNDIYYSYKDAAGNFTTITENADEGKADKIIATNYNSLDLSSPAYVNIEIGQLNQAGTLYGNALDNTLIGSSGNDNLYGSLKVSPSSGTLDSGGKDILQGGLGDDGYLLSDQDLAAGDRVVEGLNGGTDTIFFIGTKGIDLNSSQNVENLFFAQIAGSGVSWIVANGNNLNNDISCNSLPNAIGGGQGNDVLLGGVGVDYFLNTASLSNGSPRLDGGFGPLDNFGHDTIRDFINGVDKIVFKVDDKTGDGKYDAADLDAMSSIREHSSGGVIFQFDNHPESSITFMFREFLSNIVFEPTKTELSDYITGSSLIITHT